MKIKLTPFDPIYADFVWKFYYEPQYAHFSRGINRWLTKMECCSLQEVINKEAMIVLFQENDNEIFKPCGILTFFNYAPNSFYIGLAIDSDFQGKGISYKVLDVGEKYLFQKRGADLLKLEVLQCDEHIGKMLVTCGYTAQPPIPKHDLVNGRWEGMVLMYKNKR